MSSGVHRSTCEVGLSPALHQELATDLILRSLPKSFSQFVMNFNMHDMDKSITELHGMLITAEQNMVGNGSVQNVLLVNDKSKGIKRKRGRKGKKGNSKKANTSPPSEGHYRSIRP